MKTFVPAAVSVALLMAGCSSAASTPTFAVPTTPVSPLACSYPASGQASRPVQPPSTTDVLTKGTATFTLTFPDGPVTITADRSRAACTVHSFESLVSQGYYNDTSCHRLADQGLFMLQCGDPTGTGRGGPGYSFADELAGTTSYPAGTVAMANAGPNTNGSQFFIVYQDSALQPNYTVWGTLDEASLARVQALAAKGHDASLPDGTGKPKGDARIISVTAG